VDIKDIKAIIDLMKKNSITEFELEEKDSKLRLKRGLNGIPQVAQSDDVIPMIPAALPIVAPTVSIAPLAAPTGEIDIKSPMVGTLYRSPSPEAGVYVDVGTEVNPDTVVCIIEAMKVMNEIKAEVKGIITQIVVENGKPVEFGQPLFKVRPA
jgi:acetyl-CoA carboxylase biotin carboxyl carrier protein